MERSASATALSQVIAASLVLVLLLVAALGWAVTGQWMRGMDAGPWTDPGALGFYVTAWVVMMVAMMFPSIWPMVLMYVRIQAGKRERGGGQRLATAAEVRCRTGLVEQVARAAGADGRAEGRRPAKSAGRGGAERRP